jgi:hypothetical protein
MDNIKPSGDLLKLDIAPPEDKWEFAQKEWCEYASSLGCKMLKDSGLDLTSMNWCFSEEYIYTPERLMGDREVAGYYFMVKDGELSSGDGVPDHCLSLPGFHVRAAWGLIAHPSGSFYGANGQKERSQDSGRLRQELTDAGRDQEKNPLPVRPANNDGPTWPKGFGSALSVESENGGGLHNFTAFHLKPSPEVVDLPQTKWGVAILSEMSDQQKEDFYQLIGR